MDQKLECDQKDERIRQMEHQLKEQTDDLEERRLQMEKLKTTIKETDEIVQTLLNTLQIIEREMDETEVVVSTMKTENDRLKQLVATLDSSDC